MVERASRLPSRTAARRLTLNSVVAAHRPGLDHRVEHGPEHVIDERCEDPAVKSSEGVEQVGAHVEFGSHGGGADVGRADPQVRG
jgi:hypothetical protein